MPRPATCCPRGGEAPPSASGPFIGEPRAPPQVKAHLPFLLGPVSCSLAVSVSKLQLKWPQEEVLAGPPGRSR